jgi:hypothetical protein
MSPYIKFNHSYDQQELLNLFNNSQKNESKNSVRNIANLGEDCQNSDILAPLFSTFSFIPKNSDSCELSQFIKKGNPRTNPGNNGLLIFPVSGSLSLNIYDYVSEIRDSDGRPLLEPDNLSERQLAEIEQTKTETVQIDSPIAVDGLTTYSLNPTEPNTVVFILKIPTSTPWNSVVEVIQSM